MTQEYIMTVENGDWAGPDEAMSHTGKVLSDVEMVNDDLGLFVLKFRDIADAIPGYDYRKDLENRRKGELPRFISRESIFVNDFHGDFIVVAGTSNNLIQLKEKCEFREIESIDNGRYKGVDCTIIKLRDNRRIRTEQPFTIDEQMRIIAKAKQYTEVISCPVCSLIENIMKDKQESNDVAEDGRVEIAPVPPEQLMTIEEQRSYMELAVELSEYKNPQHRAIVVDRIIDNAVSYGDKIVNLNKQAESPATE